MVGQDAEIRTNIPQHHGHSLRAFFLSFIRSPLSANTCNPCRLPRLLLLAIVGCVDFVAIFSFQCSLCVAWLFCFPLSCSIDFATSAPMQQASTLVRVADINPLMLSLLSYILERERETSLFFFLFCELGLSHSEGNLCPGCLCIVPYICHIIQ